MKARSRLDVNRTCRAQRDLGLAFLAAALAAVFLETAGFFLACAAFTADLTGTVLLRTAQVLAAKAAFNSASNSAGVMGRADLRSRSMS